ncbi:uncharacterized protein BKA55DRAFT_559953 [Fusarium redolens]|uniref:Uncharacterized protein n=1 Tax=Fusarium redolens TaxID=48865 RepID=A0A9P9KKW0_FUSRE|nr:uncharacterized protein BKA55DRAFT_559953 [Fusarium redolens]KAH7260895.1 hypothetical protein BKA55DRAFT_559953 [Fusarium redolens]
MRSNALLLAIGLFVTDSVFAGPCKPRSSSSNAITTTSITSAIESTTTTLGTSTDVSSKTTTLEATTTTSVVETTATTSNAQTTTTAASDAPTIADITTTTSEAESTTTAAVATPTFKIVGGGGAVNGAVLKSLDVEGSPIMFNPNYPLNDYKPRTYIIEPSTGRVKDKDTGYYLCAYYQSSGVIEPANIAVCTGTPGPDQTSEYVNCRVVGGKLSCTVPQTVCTMDFFDPFSLPTCETSSSNEVYDQLYYRVLGDQYIFLGTGSPDNTYAAVDLIAQEA